MITKKSDRKEDLQEILHEWEQDKRIQSVLILSTFQSDFYNDFVLYHLANYKKEIWGGFFPMIFSGIEVSKNSTLCIGFESEFKIDKIERLSQKNESLEKEIESLELDINKTNTVMILIDALSEGKEELIMGLYENYGLEFNYIAGGCGDLDFQKRPCMFHKGELLEDCAIMASSSIECNIGVKHGWQIFEGPFRVTKSDGKIVKEIDFRPAFEVYKEFIDKHSPTPISKDNFFDIAKSYPFGIPKLGQEVIIRDPIQVDGNDIICVANVYENSFIYIMSGTKDTLIRSASQANHETLNKDSNNNHVIVMDCISRTLFLEDDYLKELEQINNQQTTPVGALVLGEIANQGKEYLDIFNKTIVVCRLKDVSNK
ncbi:MAG: FIST C-terminal domain-containing protein [Halobacteriovoraceae bacterium]|nr:FIST C-terminal domain-containing protein [Halobacteriovoraceae bacterium]